MACITKLAGGFGYDCDTGGTGIASALIINKGDISALSMAPDNTVISGLSLKADTAAFKIDTPKRTLVVTETLKVNEGAPNAFTHSATLVATEPQSVEFLAKIRSMTNGSFVLLVKGVLGGARAYGVYYGMSATAVDRSSHDNGARYSITIETPEQFIGEDALTVSSSVYEALFAAALD